MLHQVFRDMTKEYYQLHKEEIRKKHKIYRDTHKLHKKETDRKYYQNNKRKIHEQQRVYYQLHRQEFIDRAKRWRLQNPVKMKKARIKSNNKRRAHSMVRINDCITQAIYQSLRGKKAGRKWETLVGYTLKNLVEHLENLFDKNMSWDNQGSYWDIDHIIPKSSFSYSTAEDSEFKKCWALENLQPMEHIANLKKGVKVSGGF